MITHRDIATVRGGNFVIGKPCLLLDTAKETLKRIKEHFIFVTAYNAARGGSKKTTLLAEAKNKLWFVDSYSGCYEDSILLRDDYGVPYMCSVPNIYAYLVRMDIEAEDDEMFFEVDT